MTQLRPRRSASHPTGDHAPTTTEGTQPATEAAAPPEPRRGTRVKKPTQKALAHEIFQEPELPKPSATKRATQAKRAQGSKAKATKSKAKQDEPEEQEDDDESESNDEEHESDDEDDEDDYEEEDKSVYCICKGIDDGTSMISCEGCDDWFHFRCIGLDPQEAEKLTEYRCDECTAKSNTDQNTPATHKKSHKAGSPSTTPSKRPSLAVGSPANLGQASASSSSIKRKSNIVSEDEESNDDEPVAASKRSKTSARRPSISSRLSAGGRKSSISGAAGPSRISRAIDTSGNDEARPKALRVLTAALEDIFVNTQAQPFDSPAGTVSLGAVDQTKPPKEKADDYAKAFEDELFELSADHLGSVKKVGNKYRDKFRTFLHSLKDKKNDGLRLRIVSGHLEPRALAHLSNDELANDAIRLATEKARQDALERSTLKQESGPLRKMTHKGEIEIDTDNNVAKDQPGKFQKFKVDSTDSDAERSMPPPTPSSPFKQPFPPANRVSASEPTVSPTLLQQPLYDEGGKTAMSESPQPPRSRSPSKTMLQSPSTNFDFASVWKAQESAPSEGLEADDEAAKELGFDTTSGLPNNFDQDFLPDTVMDGEADTGTQFGEGLGHADDFIDSFLGGDESETQATAVPSTQLTIDEPPSPRSATPEADPPSELLHRFRPIMWKGAITMPDLASFTATVRQVAGRSLLPDRWAWPYFFPSEHSILPGRLQSPAGTKYMLEVINSSPKCQVIVFCLEPTFSLHFANLLGEKAPANEAQNTEAFEKLLNGFKSNGRWGVLPKSQRATTANILKDIYMVPLGKDEPLPVWMDMVENDALGPEWSEKRDRNLFLIPAVINREMIEAEASRITDRTRRRSDLRDTREPSGSVAPPPASIDRIKDSSMQNSLASPSSSESNISSNALQDLLKSLGRTTDPSHPPSSSPPGPAPRPPPFLNAAGTGPSPYPPAAGRDNYDPRAEWGQAPPGPPGGPAPGGWNQYPPQQPDGYSPPGRYNQGYGQHDYNYGGVPPEQQHGYGYGAEQGGYGEPHGYSGGYDNRGGGGNRGRDRGWGQRGGRSY